MNLSKILTILSLLYMQMLSQEVVNVELGVDGEVKDESIKVSVKRAKRDDNPPKHPNSLEVIFENQSGKHVQLWWDDSKDGVLQGSLDHTNQITVNTFLGHRFYFTPSNSTGSKENSLYEVTMMEHTGLVTLYDEKTMKSRGQEFEKEKSLWMKEYYERTGRRWQNFYPREPVSYNYYDAKENGEIIEAKTDRTQFKICDESQLTPEIESQLQTLEDEHNADPKIIKRKERCEENPDKDECKKAPPGFQMDTDDLYIGRMNGTTYCRNKISSDEELITYPIICLCAHGPHAFRIFNFLSEDEMEHIKILGQYLGLARSTVSEEALETIDRTSQTVWIERAKSFVVDNIVRRIADVVNVPQNILFLNASSESLQLVHYFSGELYKSHVDYGTDRPHNRYITYLMYLHEVTEGGNTSFPKADEKCKDENGYFGAEPTKGSAMFFYNLFPDGNVDTKTQHYAEPPVDSEKWMTNLWIWDKVFTR